MAIQQNLIDTSQLAKLVDTSPRWEQKLTNDGILNRARDADGAELRGRYNLLAVRDYCRYLKSLARLDDASEARHQALRNEKLAAKTEMAHMNLAERKGELHDARDVEFIMNNMLTYFKQRVLSIQRDPAIADPTPPGISGAAKICALALTIRLRGEGLTPWRGGGHGMGESNGSLLIFLRRPTSTPSVDSFVAP
jgi:hypothetical protein